METVLLARHGESEFSARGAVNGDPGVACPLTAVGREQARRLGETLVGEQIDLCVTSEFERTQETARLALAGRDVPMLVVPELNDMRVGSFEGRELTAYRAWAHGHGPLDEPPGGGESRAAVVRRFVDGFRIVVARPERTVLVVLHSLPIAYVVKAAAGGDPTAFMDAIDYAEAIRLSRGELESALDRLDAWSAAPVF